MKPDTPEKAKEIIQDAYYKGWEDPYIIDMDTYELAGGEPQINPDDIVPGTTYGIRVTNPIDGKLSRIAFTDIELS